MVASASITRAQENLEESIGIDHSANCTHLSVSYDGAYSKSKSSIGSKYCFTSAISTETGKVAAYELGCNRCLNAVPINF